MSEPSDTWITESDTTTQTVASAVAVVVGLILAIGLRGFDRSGFTQGFAAFLLGVVLLLAGAGMLLFGARQVITVDPRQRRIAIERISRFRTTTRVIGLDTVADFVVAEHGDQKSGRIRYHVNAKLKAGGEIALFVGFFDGSRSRLAMEKRRDRLLQCLKPMTRTPSGRHVRTEQDVRVDLAAAHRLAAQRGWDDTVYTHISAAVPGETGVYLINPFGARFDEITASSLVKVNTRGEVVDGTNRRVNPSGFAIHGAVHAARPELECVMHLHTTAGVALAMLPGGLQPTSQWAMRLHGRLGRHAYEGLALGADEQARLVANLGTLDGVLLENHGPLMVGRSVAEAWMLMYLLDRAAQAQLAAMAATGGRVNVVSDALAALTYRQWVGDGSERDGDIEWPALLRGLDAANANYRD